MRPSTAAPVLVLALCWAGAAWSAELPRFDCVITPFKMADVASPVPGVLEVVHVDRSDRVEQGQVIGMISIRDILEQYALEVGVLTNNPILKPDPK